MSMYVCCDERRREAVRRQKVVNGIDYLEVVDVVTSSLQSSRSALLVHFINPINGHSLYKRQVSIKGSTRPVQVYGVEAVQGRSSKVLRIETDNPRNFLTYTLSLTPDSHEFPLDPMLSTLEFTYQDSTDIDPLQETSCATAMQPAPEIDYMARDFNSFRQLMLDRLTTLMPTWTERSEADMGVMLVELLAYVADSLSYRQDVIATESYLATARRRISVRRHARLLDYYMHDGKNARVWMQVCVCDDILASGDEVALAKGTMLLTRVFGDDYVRISTGSATYMQAMAAQPTIFETMHSVKNLYTQHNELHFYTWGSRNCCLPKGTTSATLDRWLPNLCVGDVLIFQEMVNPLTGREEDAEPTHRCAVRLTKVERDVDLLGKLFVAQPSQITTYGTLDEVTKKQKRHERREEARRREKEEVEGRREEALLDEDEEAYEDEQTMKLPAISIHHREEERSERHVHARQESKRKRTRKQHKKAQDEKRGKHESRQQEEQEVDIADRTTTPLTTEKRDEEVDYSQEVTRIEWAFEDALPFPLTISATTSYEYGHQYIDNVSVALGNIVLADHGQSGATEKFAPVPVSTLFYPGTPDSCERDMSRQAIPPRFYPMLSYGPLTHAVPYDDSEPLTSATETMNVFSHDATPVITLTSSIPSVSSDALSTNGEGTVQGQGSGKSSIWTPERDLLDCGPMDYSFVTESESDGTTYLRFGDGQHGARPQPSGVFQAIYRIGNGVSGNVGADAIVHIVSDDTHPVDERIMGVNNPLAAQGGTEPEMSDDVRLQIPQVFQQQERGVTPQDVKMLAEQMPNVGRANAVMRWTGSWYTMYMVAEQLDSGEHFEERLRTYMERYRMAGSDIVVVPPVYVPLEITMTVTVLPGYFRSKVREMLEEVFSNRVWPDGQVGVFAVGNIDFGQPVYLNPLYGAASVVPGVATVEIETFQRLGVPGTGLQEGKLVMDWLELARLDNDPDHPENGVFHLNVEGGK